MARVRRPKRFKFLSTAVIFSSSEEPLDAPPEADVPGDGHYHDLLAPSDGVLHPRLAEVVFEHEEGSGAATVLASLVTKLLGPAIVPFAAHGLSRATSRAAFLRLGFSAFSISRLPERG